MVLDNWSLNKKLTLNFALYLVCFVLFMSASLISLNQVNKLSDDVAQDSVPDIIAILELKSISKRLFAEIQGFIATGDEGEIGEFYESTELFDAWLERWHIHSHDDVELEIKGEMKAHKEQFKAYADSLFLLAAEQSKLIEQFEALHSQLFDQLDPSVAANQVSTSGSLKDLLNEYYRLTYLRVLTFTDDDYDDVGGEQELVEDEVAQRLEELNDSLSTISSTLNSTHHAQLIDQAVSVSNDLLEARESIVEVLELVEDYEEEVLATIDDAVLLQTTEVEQAFSVARKSAQTYIIVLSVVGVLGLITIFIISRVISGSITGRLSKLVGSVEEISSGNLNHHTDVGGRDELSQLGNSFNQMASSLRETTVSKDYLDSILVNMTESLIVTSESGVIEVVNDEALYKLGYQRSELVGKHLSTLLPDNQSLIERIISTDSDKIKEECHYTTKSGELINVLLASSHFVDQHGGARGIVCVAVDVTRLKTIQWELEKANSDLQTAQAQLIQTSKLASIGELSAGVAHELNQPLMVIRNGGQMLDRKRQKGRLEEPQLIKYLDSVLANSKRMMKIIDHLRTFSRQSSSEFRPVSLHQVIRDSFFMVGEQLRLHDIKARLELPEQDVMVEGEPNQLEQVILNLVANARDALDASDTIGSKEITISVQKSMSDPSAIELLVADNASGIPQEEQSRIFDPFYTTKEEGKGTGLGLSISYGIVQQHKGSIDIAQSDSRGTVMRVTLPSIES